MNRRIYVSSAMSGIFCNPEFRHLKVKFLSDCISIEVEEEDRLEQYPNGLCLVKQDQTIMIPWHMVLMATEPREQRNKA